MIAPPAAGVAPPPALPGRVLRSRLANGLDVCLIVNRQAPVVTTALFYRAGGRDEPPGGGGVAHFLEHMMFKGSARFGPGEIDRRTQALGGSNNAFTSHDATAYYFQFARDRWREALAIEADRMAGLTLDPAEVASERQVIVEEIGLYEAEPWDALATAVEAALFPDHPYGRPVLGTRGELAATGAAELAAFHRRFYRPDNALLVVAGDVEDDDLAAVESAFGGLPAGAAARPEIPPAAPRPGLSRLERRQGEVPRLLLALRAPAVGERDHAAASLLVTVLGEGRASRLHRRFVDEEQSCSLVDVDLAETADPGPLTVALELVPGADPAAVESGLLAELADLAAGRRPVGEAELARAQRVFLADWIFDHERIHQQALAAGLALTVAGDLGRLDELLAEAAALTPDDLAAVARRTLDLDRSTAVLGWSLPRSGA